MIDQGTVVLSRYSVELATLGNGSVRLVLGAVRSRVGRLLLVTHFQMTLSTPQTVCFERVLDPERLDCIHCFLFGSMTQLQPDYSTSFLTACHCLSYAILPAIWDAQFFGEEAILGHAVEGHAGPRL